MTAQGLLARVAGMGVNISVDGNRLRLRGASSALTDEVLAGVRMHKMEILKLLQDADSPNQLPHSDVIWAALDQALQLGWTGTELIHVEPYPNRPESLLEVLQKHSGARIVDIQAEHIVIEAGDKQTSFSRWPRLPRMVFDPAGGGRPYRLVLEGDGSRNH